MKGLPGTLTLVGGLPAARKDLKMNLRITLVGLTVAVAALSGSAYAGTKDLVATCSSARLAASDRTDCRKQFKTAESDADRTAIFKAFDNKMSGFATDGSRLTAKSSDTPLVQDAQAVGK